MLSLLPTCTTTPSAPPLPPPLPFPLFNLRTLAAAAVFYNEPPGLYIYIYIYIYISGTFFFHPGAAARNFVFNFAVVWWNLVSRSFIMPDYSESVFKCWRRKEKKRKKKKKGGGGGGISAQLKLQVFMFFYIKDVFCSPSLPSQYVHVRSGPAFCLCFGDSRLELFEFWVCVLSWGNPVRLTGR